VIQEIPFKGHSMWPTLKEGDRLLVALDHFDFESGDILLVKDKNDFMAHRNISKGSTATLKGDLNPHFDGANSIYGKIIGLKRKKKTYVWGPGGQPLKKWLVYWSVYSHQRENPSLSCRINSTFFRILLIFTGWISWSIIRLKDVNRTPAPFKS